MPRLSRYTIGTRIDKLFLENIELIILAGYAKKEKKYDLIVSANGKLDLIKFFVKLAWEMTLFEDKKYLAISTPLTEVGKMLGGWCNQTERVFQPKQNSFRQKWKEK